MKATDIISFIKVSEDVIENKKKALYAKINSAKEECAEMFAISPEDMRAIRTYFHFYKDMPIFLYEKVNDLAREDGKAFVTIWIANGEDYILDPVELPKGYFKSIMTVLNWE
ncbi:MAG: hypothetical protein J1F35_06300 [Erysipelotrichales bacterium]|nr:hypothetical protein [Erysipelotrichales bacterium]